MEKTDANINILSGLSSGNYKITVYGQANDCGGDFYDSNSLNNYVANFTFTAEYSSDATITADLSYDNLTINNGVTLTIEKSGSLNISGTLTNNGALVMNSASNEYSSLIAGSKAGSGTYTYNKFISTVTTNDLISAPFNGQTFADFYATLSPYAIYQNPTGGQTKVLFGRFNNDTGLYQNNDPSGTATMDAGEGFRAGSGIYKGKFFVR